MLQDALQVAAVERAETVLGCWSGFQPLLEPEQFGSGEARSASGVGALGEGQWTPLIVAGDPCLDGADTPAEGLGDLGGRAALEGEDDGLIAEPDPLAREGLGQALEFVEGQVFVDVHGEAPRVEPKSLIFTEM